MERYVISDQIFAELSFKKSRVLLKVMSIGVLRHCVAKVLQPIVLSSPLRCVLLELRSNLRRKGRTKANQNIVVGMLQELLG